MAGWIWSGDRASLKSSKAPFDTESSHQFRNHHAHDTRDPNGSLYNFSSEPLFSPDAVNSAMMTAVCGCFCCSSSCRDVTYLSAPSQIPKFDSGFVFERVSSKEFFVLGRDGSRAATLTIPDGFITDVAVARDDTFAAGYLFFDPGARYRAR
jgi:hypothetical protein